MKLSAIKPNPANPRTIKDESFKKLCNSIEQFPKMMALRPMVIDQDGVILGGNMRFKALQHLGFKEIPDTWVKRADELTEDERRRFIIADNVSGGDWDVQDLAVNWDVKELEDWGLEIDWPTESKEAKEDDYEIPETIKTDIVLGDLFEIGQHRLLCGDSTDSDAVAKLMNGEKADMVFTDPPYGVSYQSNMRTKTSKFEVLKNDDVFLTEWIGNVLIYSTGFVFVWTSWKVIRQWIDICESIGELTNVIVWDKGGGGMGNLEKTFSSDFELCLVYNRDAELTGRRIGSVWSVKRDNNYHHPTQKPVELAATAIENVILPASIVLDLFLGSGSTMVAAHQLNRKCYGMELDPKYCQVIVDRMKKLDPTLVIKKNGIQIPNTAI